MNLRFRRELFRWKAYRHALQKHITLHNGKLLREFEKLYDSLHIAGYYRGLIYDGNRVKDAFTRIP